jgi:hypothetical protein
VPRISRGCGSSPGPGGLTGTLLADYGLFHLEADLRWIDLTAARLDELAEEIKR